MKYIGRFLSIFIFMFLCGLYPFILVFLTLVAIPFFVVNYIIAGNTYWTFDTFDKIVFGYDNFIGNTIDGFMKFFGDE